MTVLLATKLKNGFKKVNPKLEFHLKNIIINGSKRGCSGFVVNPITNKVVYLTTERCCYGGVKNYMYRTSPSTETYSNGHGYNQWADTQEELISGCMKLL